MNLHSNGSILTISDVIWRMALSWRRILIFSMAGLLASGMYVALFYTSKKADYIPEFQEYHRVMGEYEEEKDFILSHNAATADEQATKADEAAERWKSTLTATQIEAIDNAIRIKGLIKENSAYQNNSILMKVDAYKTNTLDLLLEVISDEASPNAIINSYGSYLKSEECMKLLAADLGWDIDGLGGSVYSELITTSVPAENQIAVTVIYPEFDQLQNISDAIWKELKGYQSELEKNNGVHSLVRVRESISVASNGSVADRKNEIINKQIAYHSELTDLENKMKSVPDQYHLYQYEAGKFDGGNGYFTLDVPDKPTVRAPVPVRPVLFYLLAGVLFGVVFAIGSIYVGILINTKMLKTDDFRTVFGFIVAGSVFVSRKNIVDRQILKLFRKDSLSDKNEENYIHIADTVSQMCKRKGIKEIAVLSSTAEDVGDMILPKISDLLKERGVMMVGVGNMLCEKADSKAFLNINDYVVIEKVGKARIRDVDNEISMANSFGKKPVCALGIE